MKVCRKPGAAADSLLDVDDGAGQGPGDAGYPLDLGDHEPPEVINIGRFCPDDHVIGAGDIVGLRHAVDGRNPDGDLGGFPYLGLNEDVRLHHAVLQGPRCLQPEWPRYPKAKSPPSGMSPSGMSPSGMECFVGPLGGVGHRVPTVPIGEGRITVADLGEFGLIAALAARMPQGPGTVIGIGDDAAVLAAPDSRVVATMDLLVEGRHFRRDWSGPVDIGGKAAARSLADIAAMGAAPTALIVGLAVPSDLPVVWAEDLATGLAQECARAGASVAGGDIAEAATIVLAVHRWPRPPYDAGPEAARLGATSMIDISDGLGQDLGHVAAASGAGIDIESARLEPDQALRAAAAALGGLDSLDWVLAGGEDHALAATFPPGTDLPERWVVIGQVDEGSGVRLDSRPSGRLSGWNHFR